MNRSIRLHILPALALLAAAPLSALAADVYGGVGLNGGVIGVGIATSPAASFRLEGAGGFSRSQDGREGGVDYSGDLKLRRTQVLGDWHPFDGSFRLTGGVSFNDIGVTLHGKGTGSTTINGKTADLSKETFDVAVTYPKTTPYLGLGWGHHARNGGFGFFFDVGVMVGRFKTDVTTTLVGKNGITQADVDAETQQARDSISKLSVFPSVQLGIGYQF